MSKRFFTSDHHFGHANILKHEQEMRRDKHGCRFRSADAMDSALVDLWNATVQPEDTVYHLGDFVWKSQDWASVLPFLNGTKILIAGNHDPFFKLLVRGDAASLNLAQQRAREMGVSELHLRYSIRIDGIGEVLLSHLPYRPAENRPLGLGEERYAALYPCSGGEALIVHGHVHSRWKQRFSAGHPMINVGVDVWQMKPVSEAELIQLFQEGVSC